MEPAAKHDRVAATQSVERVADIAVVPVTPAHGLTGWRKRAFDIAVASLALIALSPAFAVLAVLIALDSRGPVIFKQRRTGLNGRTFRIFKFRTMTTMEDGAQVVQAKVDDDRVTRIGAVLRVTSLDELPQLINVLRGEMSLVGPRPHAIAHDEQYGAQLPSYRQRFLAKPGITGLAQVTGWRGETDTLDKMSGRIGQDIAYIRTWTFWGDVAILARTVGVVLSRNQAH